MACPDCVQEKTVCWAGQPWPSLLKRIRGKSGKAPENPSSSPFNVASIPRMVRVDLKPVSRTHRSGNDPYELRIWMASPLAFMADSMTASDNVG
jgi:hypothetical protein